VNVTPKRWQISPGTPAGEDPRADPCSGQPLRRVSRRAAAPVAGHIDWFDATIDTLNGRIEMMTEPWSDVIERLQTIPGVGRRTAEVIVAESGAEIFRFPDHQHLASWAGVCPGHNESGGKRRSGQTNPGDVWLADALTEAASAAIRTTDTYLQAKFCESRGPGRQPPQEQGRGRGRPQDPDRRLLHHGQPR
jgi:transposase